MTTNKNLNQPAFNSTAWDVPLNANFGIIDAALGSSAALTTTNGTYDLVAAEYECLILSISGTLLGNVIYRLPSGKGGQWTVVNNATMGAFTITISSVAGGASLSIAAGSKRIIFSDGTATGVSYSDIQNSVTGGTVTGSAISGGTMTGTAISGGTLTGATVTALAAALPIDSGGTAGITAASGFDNLKQAATDTYTGVVELATGVEAAAGTDTTRALTPATLRSAVNVTGTAPIYAPRAWVVFNGSGTIAIRASGNVTSITDNAAGDYTINFTTAMPSANYAAVASVSSVSGTIAACMIPGALSGGSVASPPAPTTTAIRMVVQGASPGSTGAPDPTYVSVIIVGG